MNDINIKESWEAVKVMYDQNTNGTNEYGANFEIGGILDDMLFELLGDLARLTEEFGWDYAVDGMSLDGWKKRVWNMIEKAGLLEEYEWCEDE